MADPTFRRLDIPAASPAKLDTAFLLMRELASEMLIEPAAIDRERGIILSELRFRDLPIIRMFQARSKFLYPGQALSTRTSVGNPEIIRNAERPRFVDLYHRYYRPERATLIVTGDVDPNRIEAEIKQRFSSWRGVGEAGADPNYGVPRQRGFEVGSFVEPGVLNNVSAHWLRPYQKPQPTRTQAALDFRRHLVHSVLSRRLKRLVEGGGAPFTAADVRLSRPSRTADVTTVSVDPTDGKHAEALAVIEQEVRRGVQHGLKQSELDQAVAELRTQLRVAAAGAKTRSTSALANQLLTHVSEDEIILSPAQTLELFETAIQGFTAPEASALLKRQFEGVGPLVFAAAGAAIPGGNASLAAAYSQAQRAAVAPPPELAARTWKYASFGTPGAVAERTEISDLGATRVRFANGVTLLVKPTAFRDDEVLVTARFGGGRRVQPKTLTTFTLTQGEGAFVASGLADLSAEQIKQALSGKSYSTRFSVEDRAFTLRGATTPDDVATQLQVLAAYSTNPGWRPEVYEQKQAEIRTLLGYVQSSALNVGLTESQRVLRSGDGRSGLPNAPELAASTMEALRGVIEPSLREGPVEVVIVGDITVDDAIRHTAATFGALPARKASLPVLPGSDSLSFPPPSAEPQRLEHAGAANAAAGLVAWKTSGFHRDPQEARVLQVLQGVLQGRAIDKIREELGVTYSPAVLGTVSETHDDFGYVGLLGEVEPAQLDRFMEAVFGVAADLQAAPITADELNRVMAPLLSTLEKDRAGNDYWSTRLGSGSWDPRRLDVIRTQEAALRRITPADIQRVAQKYLKKEASVRLVVSPKT
jgi:zinc protease